MLYFRHIGKRLSSLSIIRWANGVIEVAHLCICSYSILSSFIKFIQAHAKCSKQRSIKMFPLFLLVFRFVICYELK